MATITEVIARFDKLATGGLNDRVEDELFKTAAEAEESARQFAATRLKVRRGFLVSSIRGEVVDRGGSLSVELTAGNNRVPYAAIQEFGGIIRPKRAQFLTIPLLERLRGVKARSFRPSKTFVLETGNKLFIVERTDSGDLIFLWRLVKSVRIKGKRYMRDAMDKAVRNLRGRLDKELATLIETGR